jgi:hypothetical protein
MKNSHNRNMRLGPPEVAPTVPFELENPEILEAVEGQPRYLYQLVPVQLQDLEPRHPLEDRLGEGGDPVPAQAQLLDFRYC